MPIYKQINRTTEPKNENQPAIFRGNLFYTNEELRFCEETVVGHFTGGDILIACASRRNPGVDDEVILTQGLEVHAIGEGEERWVGTPTHAPIALIFDNAESVQVLIEHLQSCKESIEAAKGQQ